MLTSHDDPPREDPPPYPFNAGYPYVNVIAGTVVPPPSTYYPFSMQVSFLMDGGLLRSNDGPTFSEPPDYMSIWTLLKTSASPLMQGDTIQLQTYPEDATYNQWGANMMFTSLWPGNFVNIWPYREAAIITDPRSKFAILRVDGLAQQIVGATSVRLLSIANGAYVRRLPVNQGWRAVACDGTVNDPETVMTIVELPANEIAKRLSLSSSTSSGHVKPPLAQDPSSLARRPLNSSADRD